MAEKLTVRPATMDDLDFVAQDGHIPRETVAGKIGRDEVIVAERDGESVGYARVEFLWSIVPFIALIWVLEPYRKQGVGTAILEYLEARFRATEHEALFSSSQVDEPEPQAWHRRMGFEDCGVIERINEGGVGEVFFRKALGPGGVK